MYSINRPSGAKTRMAKWFPEREFFTRSRGQVKFWKLSSRLQIIIAAVIAIALVSMVAVGVYVLTSQHITERERIALDAKSAEVEALQTKVDDYRASLDRLANDLEKRQDFLDSIANNYLLTDPENPDLAKDGKATANESDKAATDEKSKSGNIADKISALIPEAAHLIQIGKRQLAFVDTLTHIANARAEAAETAIRKFGLNPDTMAAAQSSAQASAQGGPFVPYFEDGSDMQHNPRFAELTRSLERMDALERSLVGIPSGEPADMNAMSSNFGYRSDPFTGQGAMHSGIDFKGIRGQSIYAAADGQISFAGWKSGYGKTVEISHGNGMMTRYAHLSSITVQPGQQVDKGVRVGGMGSTGRSTGTHLHFEVRLNGQAINPRPFLEANTDVLKTQAVARQRTDASANAGS